LNKGTTPSSSLLTGTPAIAQFTSNFTVQYSKYTETGTTFEVGGAILRSSTNNTFTTFNPAWNASISFSATQHFLKGYGKKINTNQLKVLQNNLGISRIELERQVIELLTQAERTYWDLVFTYEDLKVKQRSMDLAQKTLSDNRIQVDAGAMAAADLVQSETEVATRNEQLINSRYTQVQVSDQVKKYVTNGPGSWHRFGENYADPAGSPSNAGRCHAR
jgi:outer membrane protein TolC